MNQIRRDLLNPSLQKILKSFRLDKNYISGQGSYLQDEEGTSYLDFISQYGAVPFGYNPEFIWQKLDEVHRRLLPSLVQPSLPGEALKLANMLAQITPGDLCCCTFCQSGAEAVEASIKLARSATGKLYIVSASNSFHGKTLGALSATGKDSYQEPFFAPAPGFIRVPYNNLDSLRELFEARADEIAAVILEPIQGEGGIIVAADDYLRGVRRLCTEYGVLLIMDEIQTGLGRTGRLFACQYADIEPDIMLLAKALGGGMFPLGVCISSPRVWNDDFGMLHSSTFANNNITCAVGIAVLEKLLENEKEIIEQAAHKGDYLLDRVRQLAMDYPDVIKEVRGRGLMVGVEIHDLSNNGSYDISFIMDQGGFTALLAGFLLNVYQIRLAPFLNDSMTLRLEPPLTITYAEIDRVCDALGDLCQILHYHDYQSLYRYLIGDCRRISKPVDYRGFCRKVQASRLEENENPQECFAFVIHYPAPEDVSINNPSFNSFNRQELLNFLSWQSTMSNPGVACYMPAIKSKNGKIAHGWLIGVPLGGREIMRLPREHCVEVITKAVDMGRDLGAGIVGLGALTSVVTAGGRAVQGRGVGITSGNSFTTLMAMEALFLGADKMRIEASAARAAVVGAAGSIGRACALLLAEKAAYITLLGNPEKPSSNKRLETLADEMVQLALRRLQEEKYGGLSSWILQIKEMLLADLNPEAKELLDYFEEQPGLAILEKASDYLRIACPVNISIDIDDCLPECDLIVAASNSPEYLIYPQHMKPGAVICDVARPADVSPEVLQNRLDVLVLEGGLVQYPDEITFGPNLGYRNGVNLACLSETVLLALEGDYNDHSIGSKLSMETMEYFRYLADKHGFGLAGLRMGGQEISDEEIEAIYQRSLQQKTHTLAKNKTKCLELNRLI
ncbi:aminotransferase class III-fold pyridoxal phosphate-dependent enzyme [Syntrophomonas palmitatica]|uniref:aminotransferase class III-fold pyridoxal phosphate-dependent enzyme n=1 Tax=Syntrophomonas palmitatica TaxID=402877 RepID=UPI0006D23AF1|nr:aminotransferase class III-fold pyridoxal phosphate-dependent enzyme [Syntrophomonas palmitatica]